MQTIVVGAGLAGLAAATTLRHAGHEVLVLERDEVPGGRVQTDHVDGYLLDRGFQILLTGYPEARRFFDYDGLELCRFWPGALVRVGDSFHRVADPFREPSGLLETLRAPVGSVVDKARVLRFRWQTSRGSIEDLWSRPEVSAAQRLREVGFSERMVECFLGPLFCGITLDPELAGSSRVLEFVFRMLAAGDNAVPRRGMGQLGAQLANQMPEGAVRYGSSVTRISDSSVELESGENIAADHVILATDMDSAQSLVGSSARPWKSVTSIWYSADEPPVGDSSLILNGGGQGPINSAVEMSSISPTYAPEGKCCIVATTMSNDADAPHLVRKQLCRWFAAAEDWRELRVDRIRRAQPTGAPRLGVEVRNGVIVCGDHVSDASINGALESGRLAGETVLARTTTS